MFDDSSNLWLMADYFYSSLSRAFPKSAESKFAVASGYRIDPMFKFCVTSALLRTPGSTPIFGYSFDSSTSYSFGSFNL